MTPRLIVLLPPSETKRDGGSAVFRPRFGPGQEEARAEARRELERLAADPDAHARALRLSPRAAERERARNAALAAAPLMPAVERYTGVLYDHLDAASLPPAARAWLDERVLIQSALYGLVRADDPIAAYRASASTRLAGRSMAARWRTCGAAELGRHAGPMLDLRSKAYAALAPRPDRAEAIAGELVSRLEDGSLRALSHFGKRGKGELVRAIAAAPESVRTAFDGVGDAAELARALALVGVEAEASGERELLIIVDDPRLQARERTIP